MHTQIIIYINNQIVKDNKIAELFFFGRPKEEKLKPPSQSAVSGYCTDVVTTFLGHSQPSQLGSQRCQPVTHHRQRETSDARELPEDPTVGLCGNGSSTASLLAITVGPLLLLWSVCIQVDNKRSFRRPRFERIGLYKLN
ncbi:hypothetical protein Taro_043178 [Colocasia esculenta]|uniref:Uncharacterized protein n=1 Tax=Colocasia esculenta TaxID=4460 RepID=A0A843WUZ6_COLES|nr:hypothetical protein [Colocasia esculenta]